MQVTIRLNGKIYQTDLRRGFDLSIPLVSNASRPKCFYAPDFRVEPVVSGDFTGEVSQGSSVNFRNIMINPHGNGTHTECAGHITSENITINQTLKQHHFTARLVSVNAIKTENEDLVITSGALISAVDGSDITEAIIIRTLPNGPDKKTMDYSGTNPPYFEADAIEWLSNAGIDHLITDLPSVDREIDGGKLAAHKAFWGWPDLKNRQRTITEMAYASPEIPDGLYLCNIQTAPVETDASPSRIVIFPLSEI